MESWCKHEMIQGVTVFGGRGRPFKLAEQRWSFIGQVRLYKKKNTYGFVFIRFEELLVWTLSCCVVHSEVKAGRKLSRDRRAGVNAACHAAFRDSS